MIPSVHLGSSRAVIALPTLGIVVKVARVRLGELTQLLADNQRQQGFLGGLRKLVRQFHRYDVDTLHMPRRSLFKGIADNLREARFSGAFRHPILARTHLTLGIVNIQAHAAPLPYAHEVDGDELALVHRFTPFIGDGIFADEHLFERPGNFGVIDGHLVVVDYASEGAQRVLRMHGDRLVREFPVT